MESIKLDGNVANVRKTYANTYQIFVHLDISWILLYFPHVFPGAIYLARYSTPQVLLPEAVHESQVSATCGHRDMPLAAIGLPVWCRLFLKQVVFKRSGCYNLGGKLYCRGPAFGYYITMTLI